MSKVTKVMYLAAVGLLSASLLFATGATEPEAGEDWLEYSVYYGNETGNVASLVPGNPNDIVTPYVYNKFKIRVSEFIQPVPDMNMDSLVAQWVAAGNMPDVIMGPPGIMTTVGKAQEQFADLTDYVKEEMPHFTEWMSEVYWPEYAIDGRIYALPNQRTDWNHEIYADDAWNPGTFCWGIWVREDILEMAGYEFTPAADIFRTAAAEVRRPTLEDFAISPPIDSPEDFREFLRKVKALNLEAAGNPVIPLSITSWQQFHIGSMFDFGQWRMDAETGEIAGFLGTPEAKEYYKYLVGLYKEGLLDPDWLIQQSDQLQEKVASGRVAAGMFVPDILGAGRSMSEIVPGARLRYIPWPKRHPDKGWYDINYLSTVPGKLVGFNTYTIRHDFPDIRRLLRYFDWFYTEEGLDIATWGPPDVLYEERDGKRLFSDPQVEHDMLNNVRNGLGADHWGIHDDTAQEATWSEAVIGVPHIDVMYPTTWRRSYPPNLSKLDLMKNIMGTSGLNRDGYGSYGDNGPNVAATSNYFWGEFQNNKVAALFQAKDDAEFDREWDRLYEEFVTKGRYEAALRDMDEWFKQYRARYEPGWSFFD